MKSLDLKKPIRKSTLGAGAVRIKKNIVFSVGAQHAEPLHNDKPMSPVKLSRPRLRLTKKKTIGLAILVAIIVLVASYFIFYYQTQQSQAAEWFNQDWHYRQQFDVYNNSSTEDLLDFQVAIPSSTLGLSTLLTNNKLKSDYTDLRFTDKNGNLLDYWFPDATSTMDTVYVKFSTLTKAATTTVMMYYGNPSAPDKRNNTIFTFFDDFSGTSLNQNKWSASGTVAVASGYVRMTADAYIRSSSTVNSMLSGPGLTLEGAMRYNSASSRNSFGMVTTNYFGMDELTNTSAGLNILRYSNNAYYFERANDSNQGAETNKGDAGTTGVFTNLRITWLQGVSAYYKASSTTQTLTDYIPTTSTMYLHINCKTASTADLDWILVRKAAVVDPTVNATAGTSEEVGGGPVGYWKFDEGYGATAYDSSSYKNNGTLTNMSTSGTSTDWVDGKVNKALMFDGVNDYVVTAASSSLSGNPTFTMSAWIFWNGSWSSGYPSFMGVDTSGTSDQGLSFTIKDGRPAVDFWNNRIRANDALKTGQWYHIVGTKTAGAKTATTKIYINGKQVGTALEGTDGAPNITSAPFVIGRLDATRWFKGMIDEVKFYNYALTASQVLDEYNRSKSVIFGTDNGNKNQGLAGYWKMDEATSSWPGGASSTVSDYSGNGNNCTSTGDAQATTSAKFGNAGYFDGSVDYLTCGTSNFGITNQVTVSAWFKVLGNPAAAYHIIFMAGSTNIELDVTQAGLLRTGITNTAGTRIAFNSGSGLADGNWHFLTLTYDGNLIKGYADGIFVSSSPQSGLVRSNGAAYIGQYSSTYYTNGLIDDVKIFALARTPDQIMNDYLTGPGPIAYYNFEEGSGTAANDISGAGYTGTITPGTGSWQTGKIGTAYNFDAADTKIDTGSDWIGAGNVSVSAWVYANGWGEGSVGTILMNSGIQFYINPSRLCLYTTSAICSANNSISLSKWYYVTVTLSSTGTANFFINRMPSGTANQDSGARVGGGSVILGNVAAQNGTFDGKIDELKVYNYVLTPWQIAQEYNGGKPMAQWSFEEGQGTTVNNVYSTSTGALTNMSVTGTSTAWTTGKMGKALMFDGVNDYVTVANNSNWNFAGKDVTISLWFKANTSQVGSPNMMLNHFTGGAPGNGWYLGLASNKFYFENRANTDTILMQTDETYNDNKWHYATVVINNAFSKAYLYIDNVLKNTDTFSSLTDYIGSALTIGGQTGNYRFTGLLDEIKIYPYALSPAQIRQDYNDGLVVGLSTGDNGQNIQNGLVGYWKMDESTSSWAGAGVTVFDSSGAGNNATSYNHAKASTTAVYGNAGDFDGTDDYIEAVDNSSLDLYTAGTISLWVWPGGTTGTYQIPLSKDGGSDAAMPYSIQTDTSQSAFSCYLGNNSTAQGLSFGVITSTTWSLLTCAWDGTNLKTYVNGFKVNSAAQTVNPFNSATALDIGKPASRSYPYKGLIDDVKIYNVARASDQIMADYLNGPGPIVYYNFEEGAGTTVSDKSGNGNDPASISGFTGNDWVVGKYGYGSDFDGNGDYLTLTPGGLFNPVMGSVSLWVKPRTLCTGSPRYYFYHMYNSANRVYLRSEAACDGSGIVGIAETSVSVPAGTFRVGVWQQFTMTYASSTAYLYKNGVLVATKTYATPLDLSSTFYFSQSGTSAMDGQADEMKIWNYTLTPWQVAQEYNGGKPIGYWKLDDGQGTRINDYSGNNNYGTLNVSSSGNTVIANAWQASTNCKLNGCLSFDGTDDYVSIPDVSNSVLDLTTNISLSAWVKYSTQPTGKNHYIVEKGSDRYYFIIYASGGTNNEVTFGGGGLSAQLSTSRRLDDNQWHHIVATYSKGFGANIYVDGSLNNQAQLTGTLVADNGSFLIGSGSVINHQFGGLIDEVKVYNYAISPGQVRQDYNMGKGIFFK